MEKGCPDRTGSWTVNKPMGDAGQLSCRTFDSSRTVPVRRSSFEVPRKPKLSLYKAT